MNNNIRDWAYYHPVRKQKPGKQAPMPLFDYSATSPECPNGIIPGSKVNGGFVGLFIVESLRKQLLATAIPQLVESAKSFPHVWAYVPAITDDSLGLTDDEKFNLATNCAAEQLMKNWNMGFEPATLNTADPTHETGYITGPVVPDAGALAASVDTPEELSALLATWVKRDYLNL